MEGTVWLGMSAVMLSSSFFNTVMLKQTMCACVCACGAVSSVNIDLSVL